MFFFLLTDYRILNACDATILVREIRAETPRIIREHGETQTIIRKKNFLGFSFSRIILTYNRRLTVVFQGARKLVRENLI